MGICYGVEKQITASTTINHARLFDDDTPSTEADPYFPLSSATLRTLKEKEGIGSPDGADKPSEDNEHEDKKEHKKHKEKKQKRHKDKSSKKEKKEQKDSKKDYKAAQPDLKPTDEYLSERVKLNPHILHPPSANKKCLVLDIDYTIFDHKSDFELAQEFKRPYLHEFLKVCYTHFDIVIWSATAMCHILTKMEKLQLLDHPDFKISIVLSKEFMIPHAFPGKRKTHIQDIKPLSVLWQKFEDTYHPPNTIHIDDVVENFALNPQNGLRIDPFKDALQSRQTDKELFYLTQYLLFIGQLPSFEALDHLRWKDYIINRLYEAQNVYSLPKFLVPPPASLSLLEHHNSILIARNEIALKDKERKKSALKLGEDLELIRIEVGGEPTTHKDFVWVAEVTPVIQLS